MLSVPGPTVASGRQGSGAAFLPVVERATAVRVRVGPGVVVGWFWCIESSFGLPVADRYCATPGMSEPDDGEIVAQTVLHVEPTWPPDALYFIQMYCQGSCVWHVDAAPVE